VRGFGEEIGDLNAQATAAEEKQNDLLLRIANLPHESVPIGKDAAANRVVRTWGEKPRLTKPADHVTLGTKLNLLDMERAAKLSGSGFIVFTGAGAEAGARADQFHDRFAHAGAWLPKSVRRFWFGAIVWSARRSCPSLKRTLGLEENQVFLAPTAEVQLTNLHRDEIVSAADLPRKFVGYAPCFRREAGAAAAKPVAFFACINSTRWSWSKSRHLKSRMTNWNRLRLTRNAYCSCSACIIESSSFAPAIWVLQRPSYDIEVWSPGQDAYLEVSSCSNCEDFQARRMQLRFKIATGKIGSATR
jgi:seryl-tRNA synthetase